MAQASATIEAIVTTWEGVTAHVHRFGGKEYRFGKRELGHVHGNALVDIPFPMNVRNQLIADGVAQKHHVLPESGWVSFFIRSESDVEKAIQLLRMSYEIALDRKKVRREGIGT